jgi:hypothetical protein
MLSGLLRVLAVPNDGVQLFVVKSPQVPNTRSATVSPADPEGVPGVVSLGPEPGTNPENGLLYSSTRPLPLSAMYKSLLLSTVIPSGPLRVSGPG